jgi:hypothetical protein
MVSRRSGSARAGVASKQNMHRVRAARYGVAAKHSTDIKSSRWRPPAQAGSGNRQPAKPALPLLNRPTPIFSVRWELGHNQVLAPALRAEARARKVFRKCLVTRPTEVMRPTSGMLQTGRLRKTRLVPARGLSIALPFTAWSSTKHR